MKEGYVFFPLRKIPNIRIDTKMNIKPLIRKPNASRVLGIEKYPILLKIIITFIENTIPIIRNKIPGIPK